MQKLLSSLAVPVVTLLSGCTHVYQSYSVQKLSSPDLVKDYKEIQQHSKDLISEPKCYALLEGDELAKLKSVCMQQRNIAISGLVMTSAEECLRYRRGLYGNEAATNITLGTATNLFAGTASVAASAQGKSILGALALFTNSERSLINETVYKQMLVTAVDKKIVDMRDEKMLAIHSAMKEDTNAYPVYQAFSDVIALHNTCSFVDGLQKALQEGTQGTSAQRIARLKLSLQSLLSEQDTAKDEDYKKLLKKRIETLNAEVASEEKK